MINIREFQTRDIKKICRILNHYIRYTDYNLEEKSINEKQFNKIAENVLSNNYPFLVIEDNSKFIGFAYLDQFNPKVGYKITADLTIYLKPNLKRSGYGSMLVNEIEKLAVERGIENIISIITESNIASIRFHRRHGYKKIAYLKNIALKKGQYCGVFYFQKSIKK